MVIRAFQGEVCAPRLPNPSTAIFFRIELAGERGRGLAGAERVRAGEGDGPCVGPAGSRVCVPVSKPEMRLWWEA